MDLVGNTCTQYESQKMDVKYNEETQETDLVNDLFTTQHTQGNRSENWHANDLTDTRK